MFKTAILTITILLLLSAPAIDRQRLTKYQKLDAYEVRPGILMLPRFTAEGEFCEIGLQRLNYSPEITRVYLGLSRNEIDRVVDEVVPPDQRGRISEERPRVSFVGQASITTTEFENVTVAVLGALLSSTRKSNTVSDLVVTIKWKKRTCE